MRLRRRAPKAVSQCRQAVAAIPLTDPSMTVQLFRQSVSISQLFVWEIASQLPGIRTGIPTARSRSTYRARLLLQTQMLQVRSSIARLVRPAIALSAMAPAIKHPLLSVSFRAYRRHRFSLSVAFCERIRYSLRHIKQLLCQLLKEHIRPIVRRCASTYSTCAAKAQ